MRRVSIRTQNRTIHDVNDGFGDKTGPCRGCSLSREDSDSELIAWIGGHTKIGPVLQITALCCFDQHGIEIQVPVNIRRRIQILDYDIQSIKQLRGGVIEKIMDQRIIQASGNRTRYYQAQKRLVGHSR